VVLGGVVVIATFICNPPIVDVPERNMFLSGTLSWWITYERCLQRSETSTAVTSLKGTCSFQGGIVFPTDE